MAGVFGVGAIGLNLPFAVTAFVDDAEAIHRLHFVAGVLGFGMLLGVSLIACAIRPDTMIGPFWVAIASGVASTIAGLISGDFISGIWFPAPIAIVVLLALHPDRDAVLHIGGLDVPTVVLAVAALVPALAFALTQSELQRNGSASDPHVDFHHYSGMASYALALPLAGFAAALRVSGRRIGAWIVGVTGAGLGISSLALSDHVGAFDPLWAWLAIAWGVAVIASAEVRRSGEAP